MKKVLLAVFASVIFVSGSFADHIFGAEIEYACVGGNNYDITLKLFINCDEDAQFPEPEPFHWVTIWNNQTKSQYQIVEVYPVELDTLPPRSNSPCVDPPEGICIRKEVFKTQSSVFLPSTPQGYKLTWERCCRNNGILEPNKKLLNLDHDGSWGLQGSTPHPNNTFYGTTMDANIPDPGGVYGCNSSPVFDSLPPYTICAGFPLQLWYGATDPDGDQLTYEFCTPKHYGNWNQTWGPYCNVTYDRPNNIKGVANPPNPSCGVYNNINVGYAPGFSSTNPVPSNPPIKVDPQTGLITGTPNQVGSYAVAVCVKEYRNGVLIGTYKRDYDFVVTNDCSTIKVTLDATTTIGNDKIAEENCEQIIYTFDRGNADLSVPLTIGYSIKGSATNGVDYPTINDSITFPVGQKTVDLVVDPSYDGVTEGDEQVIIAIDAFCFFDTSSVAVTIRDVDPILIADIENDTIHCPGDQISLSPNVTGGSGGYTYTWFQNGNQIATGIPFTANPIGDTEYEVVVEDGCGTPADTSIAKVFLQKHPITVTPGPNDTIYCPGDAATVSATATGGNGPLTYTWTPGGNGSSITVNPTASQDYVVVVTDNCDNDPDTATVNVHLSRTPISVKAGPNDSINCPGEHVVLTATATGGEGQITYDWVWVTGSETTTDTFINVNPDATTTYVVTASDNCGNITDSDTVEVILNDQPPIEVIAGPDTIICPETGMQAQITASAKGGYGQLFYLWNNNVGNGQTHNVSPENSTTYIVTVSDTCGNPPASDSIRVEVLCDIVIPNVFTPLSPDGYNDIMVIENLEFFPNSQILIYNRWGTLVYKDDNYLNNWDGRIMGTSRLVSEGVYYYILNRSDGEQFHGTVTVLYGDDQ